MRAIREYNFTVKGVSLCQFRGNTLRKNNKNNRDITLQRKPLGQAEGDSRSIWPLLIIAVIASASATLYLELDEEETPWICQPLSTEIRPEVSLPCFRAIVEGRNTVVLQWQVSDPSLAACRT